MEVVNCWANGVSEILEFTTTNRRFRCNALHRIMIRRRHLRPLAPGEIGGCNVNGQKFRVEWRDEYVPAKDLKTGDTVITLGRLPDEGVSVAPNGRILTAGFMELCGLLLGDGNLQYENGRARGLTIARSETAQYMNHYREVMVQELTKVSGAPVHLVDSGRRTQCSSVTAGLELAELGFSGTAFTKRVPGWVFGLASELRLALLRGFLDADGTLDVKGRLTYYSANEALLNDIRHLCMGLGVPVTNTRYDDQETQPPGSREPVHTRMYRFTCSDPGANQRIGSHDPRYLERLRQAKPFGRKNRKYPRHGGADIGITGASVARITSIKQLPAEPVFDLEVAGTHSFIADGVVVHNSTNNNIEHQGLEFVEYTLRPWLVRWEQAINMRLLSADERQEYFVEHLVDGLLRGDQKSRYAAYHIARLDGWMNADDIRERENMNPLPDDQGLPYWQPANMLNAGADPVVDSVLKGGE